MNHALNKIFYLDNLKVFLTMLVILHHVAITYGADGGWFYREITTTVMPDTLLLTIFAAFNQSFFMGLFFFISGYFLLPSLRKKTTGLFLRDRLIRLGIPVVLFILLLYPLTVWLAYYPWTWMQFKLAMLEGWTNADLDRSGPTWFILVLLALNVLAIPLAQKLNAISVLPALHTISVVQLCVVAVVISALSFLFRLYFPEGYTIANVQIAYLPQYTFYFFAGCVVGAQRNLHGLMQQKIRVWLIPGAALLAILVLALLHAGDTAPFKGGINPFSLLYSLVQGFNSVAFSMVFLLLFYRNANTRAWFSGQAGRAAYAAYVMHAVVVVALTMSFTSVTLTPLVKFFLVGTLALGGSFGLGWIISRMPVLRRIF